MKLNMYTFFDSAAQAFTNPFFMHNDGLAIRAFQDNINAETENNMKLHPEQFTLFKVAEWEDKEAKIQPLEPPLSISVGVTLVNDTTPKYSDVDLDMVHSALQEILSLHKQEQASLKEVK